MRGYSGHNKRPQHLISAQIGCMDDLTTKRSFDSQATWVIDALILLTCYP